MRGLLLLCLACTLMACGAKSPSPSATPALNQAGTARTPAAARPPAPADPRTAFWSWFAANAAAVAAWKGAQDPLADTLASELRKVDPNLTFEVGSSEATHELIVSADGNKESFAAVKALVAAAPALPGWKVTAFRPRKEPGLELQVMGLVLRDRDVWFRAAPDPGRPGLIELTLFLKGVTAANRETMGGASMLMLDKVVGEYDVETKIGGVDVQPLPAAPARAGLRPLTDLPRVVDGWK